MGLTDQGVRELKADQNRERMFRVSKNYKMMFWLQLLLAVAFAVLASKYAGVTSHEENATFYAGMNAGAFQFLYCLLSIGIAVCIHLKSTWIQYPALGIYTVMILAALFNMSISAIPVLLASAVGIGVQIFLMPSKNALLQLKQEEGYPLFTGLDMSSEYEAPKYVAPKNESGRMDTIGGNAESEQVSAGNFAKTASFPSPASVLTEDFSEVSVESGRRTDIFGTADLREDVVAFAETASAGRMEDFSEISEPSPDLSLADMNAAQASRMYTPHAEQLPSREEVLERLRNMKDLREEQ